LWYLNTPNRESKEKQGCPRLRLRLISPYHCLNELQVAVVLLILLMTWSLALLSGQNVAPRGLYLVTGSAWNNAYPNLDVATHW
jgi:hypothetical protein